MKTAGFRYQRMFLVFPLLTLFFNTHSASANQHGIRLINGKEVAPGTYQEVVKITSNGATCTATVVGKRVIVTAAHCVSNGATATFSIAGVTYSAKMKRSPIYPAKDHNLAAGVITETSPDISVSPVSVGGKYAVGIGLTLLGYGCHDPNDTANLDGKLRVGDTVITGFSDFEMVSRSANGAAICFGDDGGPAYVVEAGKKLLLGIHTKGNIKDTNWDVRLDLTESTDFLRGFAQDNGVTICGINASDCGGVVPPSVPTCTLAANPKLLKVGESTMLTLAIKGQATSASIDGQAVPVSNPQRFYTASVAGTFTVTGNVANASGNSSCQESYSVEQGPITPDAPTCSLSAFPSTVQLGDNVTLELTVAGSADRADIDGSPIVLPSGKKIIMTTKKGTFSAKGTAVGAGGTGTCGALYTVDDGLIPPPGTPNLAVVPTYCGDNTLPTTIRKACLAIVKRDSTLANLRISEAIVIHYQDQTIEVLPVISRRMKPKSPADPKVQETLTLYANKPITMNDFQVLDSREATLTRLPARRDGEIPTSLEGRSTKGQYFIIDSLQPYAVSR